MDSAHAPLTVYVLSCYDNRIVCGPSAYIRQSRRGLVFAADKHQMGRSTTLFYIDLGQ